MRGLPTSARSSAILLGLLLAFTLLAGCTYRLAKPVPLGESVRVVVTLDDARLVRAQAYLQAAVANALEGKLGWRVSPTGSAKLALTLKQEHIDPVGTTTRDIPTRWRITLSGQALLTSRHGTSLGTYVGNGYAAGLTDEPDALHAAAERAAESLAAWLDGQAEHWPNAAAPQPDQQHP